MMPPEVVRMRASSTVFANASNLVNRDFAGIFSIGRRSFGGRNQVAQQSQGEDSPSKRGSKEQPASACGETDLYQSATSLQMMHGE